MLIATEQLSKTYQSGDLAVSAVKSVSLSIKKGEFVAIMGPSGSGKSTLLNLLGCLDTPTRGTYHLDGVLINAEANLAKIRREKLGFIFQAFNLIPQLTAVENVEVPMVYAGLSGRARRKKAFGLLDAVSLGDRADHRPSELSGGQKQRVAIARALANDPQVLIADEPTGNLDSVTSESIMEALTGLNKKGTTIILVTHEEDISHYAHRVIHMKDGNIVKDSKQK